MKFLKNIFVYALFAIPLVFDGDLMRWLIISLGTISFSIFCFEMFKFGKDFVTEVIKLILKSLSIYLLMILILTLIALFLSAVVGEDPLEVYRQLIEHGRSNQSLLTSIYWVFYLPTIYNGYLSHFGQYERKKKIMNIADVSHLEDGLWDGDENLDKLPEYYTTNMR